LVLALNELRQLLQQDKGPVMVEEAQYQAKNVGPNRDGELTPEEEEGSIDLAALLHTLRGGRRTIFATTIVISALVTAAAFLMPPWYTSKASFVPPSTSSSASSALAGQLSQLSGLGGGSSLLGGMKSPGDLYVGILKSRSIGAELVKRFDLKNVYNLEKESQAEKRLASNSTFEVGTKDSIVTISVIDKSATRAQVLANAYLDALREANGRLALSESSQRRLFFGQQLAKEKDDLEDAEVALKESQERSGLIAPGSL
jgi:tyrosine-protein kinase Etk/Wzc